MYESRIVSEIFSVKE